MSKNDIFYKILFAVELALIPMVIFAYVIIPERWVLGVFVALVLLVKIWLELFKDKFNFTHTIINSIASVAVFTTMFIILDLLNVLVTPVTVLLILLVILVNVMQIVFFKKQLPELITAVDFCYMLFECVALATFTFAPYFALTSYIGIVALALTGLVTAGYKIYALIASLFGSKAKHK